MTWEAQSITLAGTVTVFTQDGTTSKPAWRHEQKQRCSLVAPFIPVFLEENLCWGFLREWNPLRQVIYVLKWGHCLWSDCYFDGMNVVADASWRLWRLNSISSHPPSDTMPVSLGIECFWQQLRIKRCCGNYKLSKHTVSLSTGHGPAVFWVFVPVRRFFFCFSPKTCPEIKWYWSCPLLLLVLRGWNSC